MLTYGVFLRSVAHLPACPMPAGRPVYLKRRCVQRSKVCCYERPQPELNLYEARQGVGVRGRNVKPVPLGRGTCPQPLAASNTAASIGLASQRDLGGTASYTSPNRGHHQR